MTYILVYKLLQKNKVLQSSIQAFPKSCSYLYKYEQLNHY